MTNDISILSSLLAARTQVWVRYKNLERGRAPHWARARLLSTDGGFAVVKPIKHGGRLEKVPISTIKLWHSRNDNISVSKKT